MHIFIGLQIGVPCKWTGDGKWFILDNLDIIHYFPARIYNIAPVLCPPSSWLHKHYSAEFSQMVKAVMAPPEWGTCIRTIPYDMEIPALAYWNNTVAASPTDCDILILDALTGSQTAVLFGHTQQIQTLAFSSDGTFLVSGSSDKTVILWDVQIGGIVKTFYGHNDRVCSVSISADNTLIASASDDGFIYLWNIKTESCNIVEEPDIITVAFSPTDSQLLLSSSSNDVQQWSTDGYQIGPSIPDCRVEFSPDGTQFVTYTFEGETATIRNTESRAVVATIELTLARDLSGFCFSPDGRFIAATAGYSIYIWDITTSNPHLVQTLTGHANEITSLIFSSPLTLISASEDESIKFWQLGSSSADTLTPNSESQPSTSGRIRAVSLQVKENLAFSMSIEGVVKTWDILTGHCKGSYDVQSEYISFADIQLVGGRLIVAWCKETGQKIHITDAEEGLLRVVDAPCFITTGLRITGDGSRVLQIEQKSLSAWSLQTGESAGKESLEDKSGYFFDPLRMDGSKVLVVCPKESSVQGWDFGTPGSVPTQFSEVSVDRPQLHFIRNIPARVVDRITGKEVFQLCTKYADPSAAQWDGRYLIVGYGSGEVLILDFNSMISQ